MNGDEAVKTIQNHMVDLHQFNSGNTMHQPKQYDAIILDLGMPIMDGYDACKQICRIYKRLKKIKRYNSHKLLPLKKKEE